MCICKNDGWQLLEVYPLGGRLCTFLASTFRTTASADTFFTSFRFTPGAAAEFHLPSTSAVRRLKVENTTAIIEAVHLYNYESIQFH